MCLPTYRTQNAIRGFGKLGACIPRGEEGTVTRGDPDFGLRENNIHVFE